MRNPDTDTGDRTSHRCPRARPARVTPMRPKHCPARDDNGSAEAEPSTEGARNARCHLVNHLPGSHAVLVQPELPPIGNLDPLDALRAEESPRREASKPADQVELRQGGEPLRLEPLPGGKPRRCCNAGVSDSRRPESCSASTPGCWRTRACCLMTSITPRQPGPMARRQCCAQRKPGPTRRWP